MVRAWCAGVPLGSRRVCVWAVVFCWLGLASCPVLCRDGMVCWVWSAGFGGLGVGAVCGYVVRPVTTFLPIITFSQFIVYLSVTCM